MNESGWASTGDNANRMDSGADSCRIDSVNDRSISDSRAVCGGWSRTERAYSPAVRGGRSPNGRLWRYHRGLTGDGDRTQYHRPWAEGPGRPPLTVGGWGAGAERAAAAC